MFYNKKLHVVEFNSQIDHKSTKQFYKDMEFVKDQKSIGVIIRLNCPGGSPSLSYEVAEYIKAFKTHIPVYIYVESMAASGGYFIAASTGKIYSNPFAIVGSIGVIMQKMEFSGLAEKIGVQEDNITVGNFKQPISLFKPIDSDGIEYVKNQIMEPTYNLFVNYIVENRNIPIDKVKSTYADGRVFIATEVVGSLVDEIITFHNLTQTIIGDTGAKLEFVSTKKKSLREKLGLSFNLNIPQLNNGITLC